MVSQRHALLSNQAQTGSSISSIRFGTCVMLPRTREVLVNGHACPLEPKVFELLLYLIQERNRVIPKDELLRHIWKGTVVSESVIARTIMKARKAIGACLPTPFIKTIHCVGYRFVAAVDIDFDDGAAPSSAISMTLAQEAAQKVSHAHMQDSSH